MHQSTAIRLQLLSLLLLFPRRPPRVVRDELADRMLALRQDCEEDDRRACVRLGILIGEHRERRAAWRREHPDVFFYER